MKIITFIIITLLFMACSNQSYSPYTYTNEGGIYSSIEKIKFREVLFTLKPYSMIGNKKKYVVSDSIKNIVVKINEKPWAIVNSFPVATSQLPIESTLVWNLTEQTLGYAVVAPFQSAKTTLTTAGEYAVLLSNFFILENGTYFCRIESFDIRQKDGKMQTIKPYLVTIVEVKDNVRNAWLGELEVQVPN
jgi:hypothetical protein